MSLVVAPGKDLTTTRWQTFLPNLCPCICFIIESPTKAVVNDLSALLGGVESFTKSCSCHGGCSCRGGYGGHSDYRGHDGHGGCGGYDGCGGQSGYGGHGGYK